MTEAPAPKAVPPATPEASGIAVPGFIYRRADGVFIEPARSGGPADFMRFIERLFLGGFRFAGLDHGLFEQLLFPLDTVLPRGTLRLADAIVPFDPERRPLYRTVKIEPEGDVAEYFFEPLTLEVVVKRPLYGPIGADGKAEVVGHEEMLEAVPAKLDFDEFVADMWAKGVHFGLDAARVRQAIEQGETGRIEIAHWLPPTPGQDAGIEEVTNALHRDDTPKALANGRYDLRQFSNRFPQIRCHALILKKVPRVMGKLGCSISGEITEPEEPQDFDLATLAGEGTRVETRPDGQFIVANLDGFMNLDPETNQISVTEKIVHREEISLRTTGDLKIKSDAFESHGDVQEGRVVQGKDMLFHGNVYGSVQSDGGDIQILGNLVNGRASTHGGRIDIQGRASQAIVVAPDGEIHLKAAEGCTLVAHSVRVEQATNCNIVAETVEVETLESCAVAGRIIRIAKTQERRDVENIVTVLVPDLSVFEAKRAALLAERETVEASIAAQRANLKTLREQPELARFMGLEQAVRTGKVKPNAEQEAQLHKLRQRYQPALLRLRQISEGIQRLQGDIEHIDAELEHVDEQERAACLGIACSIAEVAGETQVRALDHAADIVPTAGVRPQEVGARLRQPTPGADRLFAGDSGAFEWQYVGPAGDGTPEPPPPSDS